MEERQPVLHALEAATGADTLIERIGAGLGTEGRDITGAKAADGPWVERRFANRQQRQPGKAAG